MATKENPYYNIEYSKTPDGGEVSDSGWSDMLSYEGMDNNGDPMSDKSYHIDTATWFTHSWLNYYPRARKYVNKTEVRQRIKSYGLYATAGSSYGQSNESTEMKYQRFWSPAQPGDVNPQYGYGATLILSVFQKGGRTNVIPTTKDNADGAAELESIPKNYGNCSANGRRGWTVVDHDGTAFGLPSIFNTDETSDDYKHHLPIRKIPCKVYENKELPFLEPQQKAYLWIYCTDDDVDKLAVISEVDFVSDIEAEPSNFIWRVCRQSDGETLKWERVLPVWIVKNGKWEKLEF